jgi:hypothetical protein
VIVDERPQLSAKNTTDLTPNNVLCKRWGTAEKVLVQNVNQHIPWLYDFKLDFRFR